MCLVIVLLGIFGVITFTLARRIREIAIRKVLGAGVMNITGMFVREYVLLLAISILLAWPLAYEFTSRWLSEYAYRVDQTIWPFAGVALLVLVTTFLLVGWQTGRAASIAPSKHLRNE
jgi:putative ABC transport system permease protein